MIAINDEILLRENTALESRRWIRLTRNCNNRCLFCHDVDFQDGTVVPLERIKEELFSGPADKSVERVVLSGGEPTIHPGFLQIIDMAKKAGYRRIQVITNGRAFAYRKFAERAIEAGLGEATVSVHGHTPELHDRLVGTGGAFKQAITGIRNLLSVGGAIVNADIVINALNRMHAAEIISLLAGLGVSELDLLQVIPFGNAYRNRDEILFDPSEGTGWLHEALRVAEARRTVVWTNRINAKLLEGYEKYIQAPQKLSGEVAVMANEMSALTREGRPIPCMGERCRLCFLEQLCGKLDSAVRGFSEKRFKRYRVAPHRVADGAFALLDEEIMGTPDLEMELDVSGLEDGCEPSLPRIPPEMPVALKADSPEAAIRLLKLIGRADAENVVRISLESVGGIERIAELRPLFYVDAALDIASARAVDENPELFARFPKPLTFSLRKYVTLNDAVSRACDPAVFFGRHRELRSGANVPFCIRGNRAEPPDRSCAFPLHVLGGDGKICPHRFTAYFIAEEYMVKSARCAECRFDTRCNGVHINHARRFGFSSLKPVISWHRGE